MNVIEEYTKNIIESLMSNYENTIQLYNGKNGALRLAREYGYGLRDFKVKVQDDIVVDSYFKICCRFYQLEQTVTLSEWSSEICKVL